MHNRQTELRSNNVNGDVNKPTSRRCSQINFLISQTAGVLLCLLTPSKLRQIKMSEN